MAIAASAAPKISTVEITGENLMTFGADPNTAYPNPYTLTLRDKDGNTIDHSELPKGYTVTWDLDGFKTENDTQGQYCDSYGQFSSNTSESMSTTFDLRNVPMNFIGNLTATLRAGGNTYQASKYVAALAMPVTQNAASADASQSVVIEAESGRVYDVKVAYTGVLYTGYLNEDLPGYELGRQELSDTIVYQVPCVNGTIDLWATSENGASPHISYISVALSQPSASGRRTAHHIGDSTSANKGSWAHRLVQLIKEGEYADLTALCDFCNDGAGGRNLSTYYKQGRLARVLCHVSPGDIVMLGNNGTNGMNKTFEEDLLIYINAAKAFGAKIALNSYTPHGAVSRWAKGYDESTQKFDSYRRDAYDEITRKVSEDLSRSDAEYLGFVEIGKNADAIFNAYVDDYADNGYESRDAAARAIIACFTDHNHYSADTLACDLMLNGYAGISGIVEQITGLLSRPKDK